MIFLLLTKVADSRRRRRGISTARAARIFRVLQRLARGRVATHAMRPGRIDYRLYMGEACVEQKTELYRRFLPSASEHEAVNFVESHGSAATMAEFQGLLLALEHGDTSSDSETNLLPDRALKIVNRK